MKSIQLHDWRFNEWENSKREDLDMWGGKVSGSKKPLWDILPEGSWEGEECFVVAGGPSLIGFDFERIRGKGRIIVCNKGFLYVPFADMMVAMDHDLYQWIKNGKLEEEKLGMKGGEIRKRFIQFEGLKVWLDQSNYKFDKIHFVIRTSKMKIGKMKDGIYGGNNIGIGALMMAITLGCNPIYLLGYDFYHVAKTSHFHGGYPRKQERSHVQSFLKYFDRIYPAVKRSGSVIYNLNPKSRLKRFPKKTIEEVLGGG